MLFLLENISKEDFKDLIVNKKRIIFWVHKFKKHIFYENDDYTESQEQNRKEF